MTVATDAHPQVTSITDLIDRQAELQTEADEIVRLLQLDKLLAPIGRAVRVGSSAMGRGTWIRASVCLNRCACRNEKAGACQLER